MPSPLLDGFRQTFPEYAGYPDEVLGPEVDKLLRGPDRLSVAKQMRDSDPTLRDVSDQDILGSSLRQLVGVPGTLSATAAQRKAAIDKEKTDPTGGPGWWARTKRIGGKAIQGIEQGAMAMSNQYPQQAKLSGALAPAEVVGGAAAALGAPATAGLEESRYQMGTKLKGEPPEVAERQAQGYGNVMLNLAGMAGMVGEMEGKSPRVAETPRGPIKTPAGEAPTLIDPDTGKVMEENAPASPEAQAALNQDLASKGVDVNDPKAVFDNHMQESGINVPSKVTVGETPVSTSQLGEDGIPDVQLADEAPASAVHEAEHMKADIQGTEQPPEDNDAILDAYRDRLTTAQRMRNKQTPPDRPILEPGTNAGRVDIPPTTSPIQGPKELSQVSQEAPPPGVSEPWIGEQGGPTGAGKFKAGAAQGTPATPADKRASTAADNVTRYIQSAAAVRSAPRIFSSMAIRVTGQAIKQLAMEGDATGFRAVRRMFNPSDIKSAVATLKAQDPEGFARFMAGGSFDEGNAIADAIGKPNLVAHQIPKVAIMTTRLEANLAKRGLTLADVGQATKEERLDAFTMGSKFSMTYNPSTAETAPAVEQVLGHGLKFIGKAGPVGRAFSLFPRLTANTLLMMGEDSPFLITKVLSKEFKAELGSGNTSRAIAAGSAATGVAALVGGYQMQKHNPDFMTIQSGNIKIDMKHQVPGLGQWAAVGATVYRMTHAPAGHEGKAIGDSVKDLATSILGLPGVGATVLADIVAGAPGEARRDLANFAGLVTLPFKIVENVIGLFDSEHSIQRDKSGSFWDPMKANVPGLAETLPEQRSPTHGGPIRDTPFSFLGQREPSTPTEDEMARLDIHVPWYPFKGGENNSQAANNKYRTKSGEYVDKIVTPVIQSQEYQKLGDAQKRQRLEALLSGATSTGKALSEASIDERTPAGKKALLDELAVK